jgi:dihydroflavonol-4-reductase
MILITGASGFVGAAVVRQLLQAGHEVRALVRPSSTRTNLARLPVEIARGDLHDVNSVRRAMAGIRFVFHVAADYRLWARQPQEIVATNVEGTRAVMEAALRAGVERILYTSSVATLKTRADGAPSDEKLPLDPDAAIGAY